MYRTLDACIPMLPDDKPRYLMGVGAPDDLAQAVLRGIDIFDCVLPTRIARHGAAFTPDGTINMAQSRASPATRARLTTTATATAAANFSRAYLRHLVKAKELLAHYLLSVHNIRFLIRHVEAMRARHSGRQSGANTSDHFLQRYLQTA